MKLVFIKGNIYDIYERKSVDFSLGQGISKTQVFVNKFGFIL